MKNNHLTVFCVLLFLFVSACSAPIIDAPVASGVEIQAEIRLQKKMAVEQEIAETLRGHIIAYKMLIAALPLCTTVSFDNGFRLWSIDTFPDDQQRFAERILGLDDRMHVEYIIPGSAAYNAGIRAGDIITHYNGKDISTGYKSYTKLIKKLSKEQQKLFDEKNDGEGVFLSDIKRAAKISGLRDGQSFTVQYDMDILCGYGYQYDASDQTINASADGKNIMMTRGMHRFATDDDHYAAVIGHEIAHNIMRHSDKKGYNMSAGLILGGVIEFLEIYYKTETRDPNKYALASFTRKINSPAFEAEADYVGLYIMERAGYDTSKAANFWRKMAVENDVWDTENTKMDFLRTHPMRPKRFIELDKAYKEIEVKKATGQPIMPTLEEGHDFKKIGIF